MKRMTHKDVIDTIDKAGERAAEKLKAAKAPVREYREIALSEIHPSPANPRKSFQNMEHLIESVRAVGIIEPILLRPLSEGFEIVAGERRYRAAMAVAEKNGGPGHYLMPAIIREMTDDEAYEVMTVENLQREDLTELEEARNFQSYIARKGEDGAKHLAERLGINPQYIRRRVSVLALPDGILESWDKGAIRYSHLEQFVRISDQDELKMMFEEVIKYNLPASRVKQHIDSKAPDLRSSLFDKKECARCQHNTKVQRSLFGNDFTDLKGHCLDPACFKQNQNNWLLANWDEFKKKANLQTNGFRFNNNIRYDEYEHIWKTPKAECRKCQKFISLIEVTGKVSANQCCLDKQCLNRTYAEKKTPEKKDENAPRVSWHGEYFREEFYKTRIPELVGELPVDSEKALRVSILTLLESNSAAREVFQKKDESKKEWEYYGPHVIEESWKQLSEMPGPELLETLKRLSLICLMDKNTTIPKIRREVANHLGSDLKTEWRITPEYLQKKTTREIHAIAKEFKLFEDEKAQKYLIDLGKKAGRFDTCKKGELVKVILESGIDLAGVVPGEILD